MVKSVRGPYRLRANTATCRRCGQKHKKNQCLKRIPRFVLRRVSQMPQYTAQQLRDAHFRREFRLGPKPVPPELLTHIQRGIRATYYRFTLPRQQVRQEAEWAAELAALENDAHCDE